jgi:hypothetical protein
MPKFLSSPREALLDLMEGVAEFRRQPPVPLVSEYLVGNPDTSYIREQHRQSVLLAFDIQKEWRDAFNLQFPLAEP